MSYDTWSEAKAAAIKILGKGADVPDPKGQTLSKMDDFEKARKAFGTIYNEFGPKLDSFWNKVNAFIEVMGEHRDLVAKSSFGLDPKKKDDAKKIADAHTLFSDDFFHPAIQNELDFLSKLDRLYKAWKAVNA